MINRNIVADSAKLVQAAIEDAGRSKRSLSDETGIPYPTLNRKLKAQTEFSFTELFAIAEALGVPPWKFTPTLFSKPAQLVHEKTAA
ncbi:helix-turn-helix transcriptional regulator [Leucobacter sp. UT-8R-CII-1-4]|uniref:helix-turn-helix domain-containing protein n=1 Tax=Leucobacter sp. UT-8R-CII-1-4 TaxID=3040075 RepID=UPI0024A95E56|nr:helix-turn-helix transcriptional regulator [Leucobacter sp. UT-8R-CII-1-4]MDI6024501.1 helix-turn-helix transcriptional regulator [Leucobacter sp. UT-8R-CII-1-4]